MEHSSSGKHYDGNSSAAVNDNRGQGKKTTTAVSSFGELTSLLEKAGCSANKLALVSSFPISQVPIHIPPRPPMEVWQKPRVPPSSNNRQPAHQPPKLPREFPHSAGLVNNKVKRTSLPGPRQQNPGSQQLQRHAPAPANSSRLQSIHENKAMLERQASGPVPAFQSNQQQHQNQKQQLHQKQPQQQQQQEPAPAFQAKQLHQQQPPQQPIPSFQANHQQQQQKHQQLQQQQQPVVPSFQANQLHQKQPLKPTSSQRQTPQQLVPLFQANHQQHHHQQQLHQKQQQQQQHPQPVPSFQSNQLHQTQPHSQPPQPQHQPHQEPVPSFLANQQQHQHQQLHQKHQQQPVPSFQANQMNQKHPLKQTPPHQQPVPSFQANQHQHQHLHHQQQPNHHQQQQQQPSQREQQRPHQKQLHQHYQQVLNQPQQQGQQQLHQQLHHPQQTQPQWNRASLLPHQKPLKATAKRTKKTLSTPPLLSPILNSFNVNAPKSGSIQSLTSESRMLPAQEEDFRELLAKETLPSSIYDVDEMLSPLRPDSYCKTWSLYPDQNSHRLRNLNQYQATEHAVQKLVRPPKQNVPVPQQQRRPGSNVISPIPVPLHPPLPGRKPISAIQKRFSAVRKFRKYKLTSDGRHPHVVPYANNIIRLTPEQIEAAIPENASCVFHIFDRRVNLDAQPPNVSMYALLRAWVQDDPYRQVPSPGSSLVDYLSDTDSLLRNEPIVNPDDNNHRQSTERGLQGTITTMNAYGKGQCTSFVVNLTDELAGRARMRLHLRPTASNLKAELTAKARMRRRQKQEESFLRQRQARKSLEGMGIKLNGQAGKNS